jgi:hypothetical protein
LAAVETAAERPTRNGPLESTGKPGDRPLTVVTRTAAGTYASLSGWVERSGVGPQADLVDHHRRHRDGVPATAGPFRVELFAGFGDLVELETEQTVFVDAGQQQLAGGGGDGRFVSPPAAKSSLSSESGMRGFSSCPAPGPLLRRRGHYVLGYSITVAGLM